MARMTQDLLQIFLAVAQHLHFTRAADALYISQPAGVRSNSKSGKAVSSQAVPSDWAAS